ncbi:succinate dehydrogenase, hydrophobic membrane anchor protein [Rhodobacter sp. NTK016B]|uniref:Succinate dehydrogenase hydrophobic membrane anchor subunit n=1 Tax=Pararhodobacter marinus TaxID=2184063 RepID=A0A2U2CJ80_9RHOB|nr:MULTISPECIES: succinate dehydrogenase, hydrophobic membrane anchor protein [Paracoccaceae]MBN8292331.1 succinate dehydrogenase, hydrophobic membrane anchor protein [Rhodobacter sp. NTK016B]PWE31911.1 succinate dehydrogenase, hydrophobic membrane anchor protein [Pararhodobacter marinus]
MSYKTDYNRVQGLGRAGEGVGHFWIQRVTAMALVPLAILFLIPFANALGGGYEALVATYSQFGNALTAALFILVASWHFSIGIQVVIEDYTQGGTRLVLIVLSKFFSFVLGAAGVLAVAKILFSA